MRINIALASTDSDEDVDNIINLKQRIEENVDSAKLAQEQKPLSPDDAAAGVLGSILNVIVGKEFLNNIVETIREWVKSRPAMAEASKSRLEIVVEGENGKKTTIKVENMKDLEKIESLAKSIA